ncbi:MAG: O-antigen ligase family protein [Ardenticatenaceae bacterium]|nr:O-antigen ligase family protein [Ardenticatenaceae bacterium]MCB9446601.1 O-antigen ligase family protein [Ardenticatenaceae bacterium]
MSATRRRWLERGGWLVAFLLPLFFNPLALADPFEPAKVWLLRLIVLGMAGVALWPGDGRLHWRRENPLAGSVAVYGVMVGLATAVSINVHASLWGLHGTVTILALLAFFLLLAAALRDRQQVEDLINVMLVGSAPVALYGLIQYLGLDPLVWQSDSVSPVQSTMGRSLYLGGYLAMIIPFTLARLVRYMSEKQRPRQIAFTILLLLQLICLWVTLARGAWLGFCSVMLLFAVLLTGRRLRWIIVSSVIGAAGLYFASQIGLSAFSDQLNIDLGQVRAISDAARLSTWADALALVPGRWLLGYGLETYATAVQQQFGVIIGPYTGHLPDPHNLLLYQITAVGISGLLAFLWVNGRFYRLLLARFRLTQDVSTRLLLAAILSSVTAYLIQAQFNPDVITLSAFFWLNLAVGISLLRQEVTTINNNSA